MDDKIKLAKGITKFVVGTSVGSVVAKAVKSNVAATNTLDGVQLIVGAYAIGGMVSDRAVDWAGPKFDEAVDTVLKIKATLKENADK